MHDDALRFGANYTPARGWFHHWLDFDLDDVRADLDSIAALGLDHIRVFPLWPVFQPNRTLIRPRAVEQLVALADAAAERGLDVNVDGLQGHLSSFDFLPSWTRTWHRRSIFTDPDVVAGQEEYLRTLAAALAGRPNFLGMTVGNEINQFSDAPHPDPDRITPDQAARWLERMLAACEEGAPGRLHLHAEYDAAWYQDGHPFTAAQAARMGAATAVHSWVFNGTAQRHGGSGAATEHHAAYLIELSKAWSLDPHRPVWLQEVGAPAPLIPPDRAARFTEATVANALDCPDVWGVTWWCSHDVSRGLADFPELEYGLGLLTNDRRTKPAGAAIARITEEWRGRAHRPALRTTALAVDVREDLGEGLTAGITVDVGGVPGGNGRVPGGAAEAAPGRSVCAPGGAFFEAWATLAARGCDPRSCWRSTPRTRPTWPRAASPRYCACTT